MKKILLTSLLSMMICWSYSQTIYYWVGGTAPTSSINTNTNWNSSLNGTGAARPSSTGTSDILVFDGSNVGGATPTTGLVAVLANGSVSCAQMKFVNNAMVTFVRATTGTSTMTIAGDVGDDFLIEAGSSLSLVNGAGSIRFAMAATTTGRVSGALSMITGLQARFDNTTLGLPGSFVFTNGSIFTTNITAASSSYAFGSATQSSEKWVVFEDGAHLYYTGGYSPMGGTSGYSAIDFKPGSTWHHRASNPLTGFGSFFNRKSFGNISVENNASLVADGPIYRINNLVIDAGSSFTTAGIGQTAVMGNITANGTLSGPAGGSNELLLAGNTPQNISGVAAIAVNGLVIADRADVTLAKNITVEQNFIALGKINFGGQQVTGAATFTAEGVTSALPATVNAIAGNYHLTGNTSIPGAARGQSITGAGIPAGTVVVGFSTTSDSVYLSRAVTASATGVAVTTGSGGATLAASHVNGFDVTGAVAVAGTRLFRDGINYIINGPTNSPFGLSTGFSGTSVRTGFVTINAAATTNTGVWVSQALGINSKLTLRPADTVHIMNGAAINGTFNSGNYIAISANTTTGAQSVIQYDGLTGSKVIPIGTATYYLPVTINPVSTSDFVVSVFEGITTNGAVNGTPFTALQKQTVINAVWKVLRLNGTGNANLAFSWQAALEGSTFTTLPNTDIGVIQNTGSLWSVPLGPGDNLANTASATVSTFGAFSVGAIPQVAPFVFNDLPTKNYGDADFTGGATSLNTTQPIIYTSSNTGVATIVSGAIHITGTGTTNITASQVSDGLYPAASVTKILTVNKVPLSITVDNKTKFEGQANPALTATYSGFVYGETPAVLLTPVVLTTTAVTASLPGTYPITASGATAANYNITIVNGTLTVQPRQNQVITFAAPVTKTYGNADFPLVATGTNTTIPIVFTSSNTAVATVTGNMVHIVSAGTTTITASQAGNAGYFPATSVARTLTVNKVPLTIRVSDTTKMFGEPNPEFRVTYTGFVLGETAANLSPAPVVNTIAGTNSAPGYYPVTADGAGSPNYTITSLAGRLTIYPSSGTTELYMNAFKSSSATLTVRLYSAKPALADVLLYDMNGKLITKKNLFMPIGFINTDLFISTVPAGIYVVAVKGREVDLKRTIFINP